MLSPFWPVWHIFATYALSQLLISRAFNSKVDGWREERLCDSLVICPEGKGHCQSGFRYWKGFWPANHLYMSRRPSAIFPHYSALENETSTVKMHAGNETKHFIFYCHRELCFFWMLMFILCSTDTYRVVLTPPVLLKLIAPLPISQSPPAFYTITVLL